MRGRADSSAPSTGVRQEPQGLWNQFGPDYDLPPFEGVPRLLVIATTPRCGSHYLGHLMRRTGALGAPLEYFADARLKEWQRHCSAQDLDGVLNYLFRHRTSANGWFSVKAHWPQFASFMGRGHRLRTEDVSQWIWLKRKDAVKQAVSWVRAQQTGSWISFRCSQQAVRYDFQAIHAAFDSVLGEQRSWGRFFAGQVSAPPLQLYYEDLAIDPMATLERVLRFAGVSSPPEGDGRFRWLPACQHTADNNRWADRFRAEYLHRHGALPHVEPWRGAEASSPSLVYSNSESQ